MKSSDTIASVLTNKSTEIWWIEPTATVYQAIEVMAGRGVGALLVMSGGKLVGIISERDYARKVILLDRSSHQCQVQQIMTSPVTTVSPDNTVDECMRIMTEHRHSSFTGSASRESCGRGHHRGSGEMDRHIAGGDDRAVARVY